MLLHKPKAYRHILFNGREGINTEKWNASFLLVLVLFEVHLKWKLMGDVQLAMAPSSSPSNTGQASFLVTFISKYAYLFVICICGMHCQNVSARRYGRFRHEAKPSKILTPFHHLQFDQNDMQSSSYTPLLSLGGALSLWEQLLFVAGKPTSPSTSKVSTSITCLSPYFPNRNRLPMIFAGLIISSFAKILYIVPVIWDYDGIKFHHLIMMTVFTSNMEALSGTPPPLGQPCDIFPSYGGACRKMC